MLPLAWQLPHAEPGAAADPARTFVSGTSQLTRRAGLLSWVVMPRLENQDASITVR